MGFFFFGFDLKGWFDEVGEMCFLFLLVGLMRYVFGFEVVLCGCWILVGIRGRGWIVYG